MATLFVPHVGIPGVTFCMPAPIITATEDTIIRITTRIARDLYPQAEMSLSGCSAPSHPKTLIRTINKLRETSQCKKADMARSGRLYFHGSCSQYVDRWPWRGLVTRKALRRVANRAHSAAVIIEVNMPLY